MDNGAVIHTVIEEWRAAEVANDVKRKQELQLVLKEELANVIEKDEQLVNVIANMLYPNITQLLLTLDVSEPFNTRLLPWLEKLSVAIKAGNVNALNIPVDSEYLDLIRSAPETFNGALANFDYQAATLLPVSAIELARGLNSLRLTKENQEKDREVINNASIAEVDINNITDDVIKDAIKTFKARVAELDNLTVVGTEFETPFKILMLEEQLLDEIRRIDANRDFYYNAPMTTSMAIELNEGSSSLNTLMNPHTNYDINNINNNFVISKLDIDFLDTGIQIARSSRLN
jgi:hypothetical protein